MDTFFVAVQSSDGQGIIPKPLSSLEDGIMKCRSQKFVVVAEDGEVLFSGNGETTTRYLHFRASCTGLRVEGYKAFDKGEPVLSIKCISVFKEI